MPADQRPTQGYGPDGYPLSPQHNTSALLLRSPSMFALVVSVLLVTLYNLRFWNELFDKVLTPSLEEIAFILSIFVTLVLAHATILLLVPRLLPLRIVTAAIFLLAALVAFFSDSYAVIIDEEMIRNLVETDAQEAGAFLVPRLAAYVVLLGLVPAIWALRVRLIAPPFGLGILHRFTFIVVAISIIAGLLWAFFPHYTSFFSEHKSRKLLNPAQPIFAAVTYFNDSAASDVAFIDHPGGQARRLPSAKRDAPLLLFLAIGETARAHNFQLGGYARPTNPKLSRLQDVYYFDNVASCATSTAASVPCIFSPHGRSALDVDEARRHTNLLDTLEFAGFNVEWRENNSSSKGVAARIRTKSYLANAKESGCYRESCYDEQMLVGLSQELKNLNQDSVIVFHDMGSHGPAYWRRYPRRFARFKPECKTSELWKCSVESVVNTYDNSLVYTDYVLAQRIDFLKSLSDRIDSLLIYVSDHGESLGERGIYLHGAPYAFAPATQTRVPLLIWMSEGYRRRFSIDNGCLQSQSQNRLSHDNVYHTVLGALGLRNGFYQRTLDLFGRCNAIRPSTIGESEPNGSDVNSKSRDPNVP